MINSLKGREMFTHISPIYEQSLVMQAIFEAIGQEFDNIEKLTEEVLKQLFPQTATWGLIYWEDAVNIVTNINEDIERRRGKVIAKLQTKYTITPERMAIIIKNYIGAHVIITEGVADYTFKVSTCADEDTRDLNNIVKKIKPSHLSWIPGFTLKFVNEEKFEIKNINRVFIKTNNKQVIKSTKIRCSISNLNNFTARVVKEKNLWRLDGTYNLDGTKLLNAERIKEEL